MSSKRLQVLISAGLDARIQKAAQRSRMSKGEWVRLAVERALAEARRIQRREPARAAEILGALDLARMPSAVVRAVYGCWLHTCRRLGLTDAVHYSPGSGRGAILVPDGEGRLKVVAAIGLSGWTPGRSFSAKAAGMYIGVLLSHGSSTSVPTVAATRIVAISSA